ncbi:hypothetical protein L226DRAFT_323638 [Lentinus tigrinus ALCF2SS1-7]|uniref:Uncharacterized protein n=1 Tax=Lentinus tigrinus ALCF2SS1-6 TaxID=1328759 RepID=A0A5C2SG85_9APHY|nr:hypothetical protein L227DRAFT_435429 [Lentinus tigrinus ALCF2SS1-6]RPD77486.1 hypothetical protein L226DRAFT_323638 [Lentinus tigrinus ALCF2SS1-7]
MASLAVPMARHISHFVPACATHTPVSIAPLGRVYPPSPCFYPGRMARDSAIPLVIVHRASSISTWTLAACFALSLPPPSHVTTVTNSWTFSNKLFHPSRSLLGLLSRIQIIVVRAAPVRRKCCCSAMPVCCCRPIPLPCLLYRKLSSIRRHTPTHTQYTFPPSLRPSTPPPAVLLL